MRITIETIPHSSQRYPTCGDWQWEDDGDSLTIKVSKLTDWRREALIAVHELIEVLMCRNDGVSQRSVEDFDMAYEKTRPEHDNSEPGDSPDAPYRRQHFVATNIERQLADALGVKWHEYESEIYSL